MTAEHREEVSSAHSEERLRFITSPLLKDHEHESHSPPGEGVKHISNVREPDIPFANRDFDLHESPAFHRHAEAQSIELFYDLFFVANLTNFTTNHNINNVDTLSSYVGFFCIIWFTWYQVSLFDVRFSVDSVLDRIFKVLQFGVMVGFAAIGGRFNPDDVGKDPVPFRALTLILMASRLVLAFQYSLTLVYTFKYPRIRFPLLMIIASTFTAAMIYMGLYFSFKAGQTTHSYIAWYIVAILETALTTVVSCVWRIVSFRGTHLVERLSLLTLIILGEGIILLMKAIYYLTYGAYDFTASTGGTIAASIFIIYFFYMMYYDRMREDHFGTIRQQLWSFAHFPYHIALVLALEGTRQFVLWRQIVQVAYTTDTYVYGWDFSLDKTETYLQDAAYYIHKYAYEILNLVKEEYDTSETYVKIDTYATGIANGLNNTVEELQGMQWQIWTAIMNVEFQILGVKKPKNKKADESAETDALDSTKQFSEIVNIYVMVLIYFFVAAGMVFILNGILAWVASPPKKLGDALRGGTNFIFGAGLCLLALISKDFTSVEADEVKPGVEFLLSAWILPTLVLCQFVVVASQHIGFKFKKS